MGNDHYRLQPLAFATLLTLVIFSLGARSQAAPALPSVITSPALNVIHGATVDVATSELVLFGEHIPALPPIDPNDMRVALRSRFNTNAAPQDQWPGVTIEFSTTSQIAQDVFYFGPVTNTHFGAVLFEADRLLKSYSLGYDNAGGVATPINSAVPGYLSELDCLAARDYAPDPGVDIRWRKWFSPTLSVQRAADSHALSITNNRVAVSWAYDTTTRSTAVDACAAQFIDHFATHYDAFAAEQQARGNPALSELKQLGAMIAIAEWLQDQAINRYVPGLNHDWLERLPVTTHQTPSTTPLIAPASGSLQLLGGVDLYVDKAGFAVAPGSLAEARAALAARPSASTAAWEYIYGTCSQLASRDPRPTAGCSFKAEVFPLQPAGGRVVDRTPSKMSITGAGGALSPSRRGRPSGGFDGPGIATLPVDLLDPQIQSVRLSLEAAVIRSHTQSSPPALAATPEALLIKLVPAQGNPVLLHTFTGEGREGQWTVLPGFELSPYIGQQFTIAIEAQIAEGSGTIFYFGGLEVIASLAPAPHPTTTPSPSPSTTPEPSPSVTPIVDERYTVHLPLLRR